LSSVVLAAIAGKVTGRPATNTVCSQVRRDRDVRFKSASRSNSGADSELEFRFEFIAGARRFEFI